MELHFCGYVEVKADQSAHMGRSTQSFSQLHMQ